MEDVLTQIADPNIVLEPITTQKLYLSTTRPSVSKPFVEKETAKPIASKLKTSATQYTDYSDSTREILIDRILESPEERGRATRLAKQLGINPRTAQRWWVQYQKSGEVPYKQSRFNSGPECLFTSTHQDFVQSIVDKDPQLFTKDIIDRLSEEFKGFTISKTKLNHHLRNTMLISVKSYSLLFNSSAIHLT
ncbi:hypothetical protein BCV72DRAFT_253381 [Rhizopus microsporus var. microsporus]|uniref:Uncharacterized protein n=1 Tax=Rhizopus microsporus var. microsporus TaxID=86635 RepID=A0A1X0QMC4_RHIZD|nr:hypothetical protein BCV72DRAFT_253381 [Rhizopus microsporus var. microsporus]